jgi:hypothetical protein
MNDFQGCAVSTELNRAEIRADAASKYEDARKVVFDAEVVREYQFFREDSAAFIRNTCTLAEKDDSRAQAFLDAIAGITDTTKPSAIRLAAFHAALGDHIGAMVDDLLEY